MSVTYRLGTQSWKFRAWTGPFYPPGTRSDTMLRFYASVFDAIEIDATFYGVPPRAVLESWSAQVPESFRFALKVPQQITHEQRLSGCEGFLQRFVERIEVLGAKKGPLLIQLGPDFLPTIENVNRVEEFLAGLPGGHQWAIEFRHGGWHAETIRSMLQGHGIALALADSRWHRRDQLLELAARPTADFLYVRWMGQSRPYTDYSRLQDDRTNELEQWASVLSRVPATVNTVFGFANNQFEGHSPQTVTRLAKLLGLSAVDPTSLHPQGELFSR